MPVLRHAVLVKEPMRQGHVVEGAHVDIIYLQIGDLVLLQRKLLVHIAQVNLHLFTVVTGGHIEIHKVRVLGRNIAEALQPLFFRAQFFLFLQDHAAGLVCDVVHPK